MNAVGVCKNAAYMLGLTTPSTPTMYIHTSAVQVRGRIALFLLQFAMILYIVEALARENAHRGMVREVPRFTNEIGCKTVYETVPLRRSQYLRMLCSQPSKNGAPLSGTIPLLEHTRSTKLGDAKM